MKSKKNDCEFCVENAIIFKAEIFSDESGALWHPPVRAYQNQWVYAVRDQTALEKQVQSIFTNESAIISQTE